MLKKILLGLAVVIVIFLIVVAMQSPNFLVTRSTTINAPPDVVFAQVNDLHKFQAWNPWGKIDPAMKESYGGTAAGVGAIYNWVGNSQVGEGRMTIIEVQTNELVRMNLEFIKPMAGLSVVDFTMKPAGAQTTITWTMSGKNNFIAKAFCLFVNMDKMVGPQFDSGLGMLKAICESPTKKSTTPGA